MTAFLLHVQARSDRGVGHVHRSAALFKQLTALGAEVCCRVNGDEVGIDLASRLGLSESSRSAQAKARVLVVDALELSEADVSFYAGFEKRFLISPVFDDYRFFTHIFVRSPITGSQGLVPETARVYCKPSYAFVTCASAVHHRSDLSRVDVGICLSGSVSFSFIRRLVSAVASVTKVDTIRLVVPDAHSAAVSDTGKVIQGGVLLNPWDFFENINVFIGGEGLMLAEAVSRGVPTFSVATGDSCRNQSLSSIGALQVIRGQALFSTNFYTQAFTSANLASMREACVALNGADLANELALDILAVGTSISGDEVCISS